MSSADVPPFVGIVGPPGSGKTTDIVRAVGASALVACSDGALKPCKGVLHLDMAKVREYKANTLEDATKALMLMGKMPPAQRPLFYVADEFSWLCQNTLQEIEAKTSAWPYNKLRAKVTDFRNAARSSGIGVVVNGWEVGPTAKNGKSVRGGMMLPADMAEYFPGLCDYFMRAAYDPTRSKHPWVYQTRGNSEWSMKDRDNKTPNPAPQNLGEILRFAGYTVPRWFSWHTTEYQGLRQIVQDNAAANAGILNPGIPDMMMQHLRSKYPQAHPAHVFWLVQDVIDGHFLQTTYEKQWASFT